jgi:hypothetical protein
MTAHTDCRHPASKLDRANCRKITQWLEQARARGLNVRENECQTESIQQWTIDSSISYLVLTWGHGDSVTVMRHMHYVHDEEKLSHNRVPLWISVLISPEEW